MQIAWKFSRFLISWLHFYIFFILACQSVDAFREGYKSVKEPPNFTHQSIVFTARQIAGETIAQVVSIFFGFSNKRFSLFSLPLFLLLFSYFLARLVRFFFGLELHLFPIAFEGHNLVQKSRLNFSLYSAVRLFASPVNFCNVSVKANSSSLNGVWGVFPFSSSKAWPTSKMA